MDRGEKVDGVGDRDAYLYQRGARVWPAQLTACTFEMRLPFGVYCFGFSALRFSVRRRQHHLPRQDKVSFNLTLRFAVAVGFACNALSRAWSVAALRRNSENPGLHELVFDFARECFGQLAGRA